MSLKNVYFIGIGGIGMSAIAQYYHHAGYQVSGYDRTPSRLTEKLESQGIRIHYEDQPELIPTTLDDTLIIYTPAIPASLKELQTAREGGYRLVKRSLALGEIAQGQETLAIAGTHGKTTTSTLLAHLLTDSGAGCNAFLGGISKNYHTNLLLAKNPVLVAEADEFDRSFLQLFPDIAAITAIDADHLDIYNDLQQIQAAFLQFARQIKKAIVLKQGVSLGVPDDALTASVYRYAYDQPADFYAKDLQPLPGGYFEFTLHTPGEPIPHCQVGIPGWVNVENAVAAAAVAWLHGMNPEAIRKGLRSFQGVERRFDVHVNTPACAYVDDYAHHPKEIAAALSSIRNIFPGRRVTVVFQPHLYTRTRDFYEEFAAALSQADDVILLPIYPAREEPIEGVNAEMILEKIQGPTAQVIAKDQLLSHLKQQAIDILITFGAGDIDRLIQPITELLKTTR